MPVTTSRFFVFFIGLSILGYLLPYHSPLGRDFLVNTFSFVCMALGLVGFFWHNAIDRSLISTSVWSWVMFAVLLAIQPLLLHISYPDALMFPIVCLLVVALVGVVASQLDKVFLLNRLFVFAYLMAFLTFVIQIMQINNWTYSLGGWVVIRDSTLAARLDGNFGQANHTGYGFVLALCGVVYQLHQSFVNDDIRRGFHHKFLTAYRVGLVFLFAMFVAGLAWTQSRAGMMMMLVVFLVYFFAQPMAWRTKFGLVGLSWLFFGLYYVGASWLGSVMLGQGNLGAVSRMAGGQGNRSALYERGMMMFSDHILTGVGWNNYMKASIDYAEQFRWPELADHSHNFFSMILAEMGLLGVVCCLPIVWVLVRGVHFRHSSQSAIACAFVVASLLYASVEYPLWYFRYLAVFALFLALIEPRYFDEIYDKTIHINRQAWTIFGLNGLFALFSLVVAIGGIFYANQYLKLDYLNYSRFTTHKNHAFTDNQITYKQPLFGFSAYDERLLAMKIPVNDHNLEKKLAIFGDVLNNDSSQYNMLAYAQLLVFKGEKEKAFKYVKAACLMVRDLSFCDNVDSDLEKLAKNNPAAFAELYQRFVKWREQNPDKTGLNIKSEFDK